MDIDELYDLERDMSEDSTVISYLKDKEVAKEFYRALCNMRWERIVKLPDDVRIINKLKGVRSDIYSVTWRGAGGIIADIRNKHYNTSEDYMDFYCSGLEGEVNPLVEKCFKKLGWRRCPW